MTGEKPNSVIPEAKYPISYREKDAQALAEIIKKHESVCLVAMKKVGISTFSRFFYYHPRVKEKYFSKEKGKYLFILCDLNDLLAINLQAFWVLVFKRFSDAIAASDIPTKVKNRVDKLFLHSISVTDPFFAFDNLKRSIATTASQTDFSLVLFLLRFDRLSSLFSKQFFANLQSLHDTAKFRVSFVTTAVRTLPELCPDVFSGAHISTFIHSYFLKPAEKKDMQAIAYDLNLTKDYSQKIDLKIQKKILGMAGGHIMLTRLIPIIFSGSKKADLSASDLLTDERISLTLEEIWENLTNEEKNFLADVAQGKRTSPKAKVNYLFKTGILKKLKNKLLFFSPLLAAWVKNKVEKQIKEEKIDFTQKEKLLFDLLLSKNGKLCQRDEIEETVWSEYQESADMAISDWAIDRLVSRLRKKLKAKESDYKIVTLRGRGYKLIKI